MNIAIKMIAYMIVFNVAIGVMVSAVPLFAQNVLYRHGMSYDGSYSQAFANGVKSDVNPSTLMQSSGNLIYRVLDLVTLGLVSKIKLVFDLYVYGFINVLASIFYGLLDSDTYAFFFTPPGQGLLPGAAYIMQDIAYAFALFMLWTGKGNIVGD